MFKIYLLVQIVTEIISTQIDIYFYCIGTCSVTNSSFVLTSNLNKKDPPFEAYPPVYTDSINTAETKLYFKVEDPFYAGISGHITVNGYSFYIGISDYFKFEEDEDQPLTKIDFYEKKEPKLLQYAYINVGIKRKAIKFFFIVPQGENLYDAQVPLFDKNCLIKYYHTPNEREIDFSELFTQTLTSKSITFPSKFPGKINGSSPTYSSIPIQNPNSKLLISLNPNTFINITTYGGVGSKTCSGYAIISSIEAEGCQNYDASGSKCKKCFDGFYILDKDGICRVKKEGYFYNDYSEKYIKCYDSCKSCKFKGNSNVHNCDECKSVFSYKYKPDYCEYNFCYKNCSDGGLMEYFSPENLNHCNLGCRISDGYLSYENRLCIEEKQTLGFGLFILKEENRAVKDCPPRFPFHQISNDNKTITCVKKCQDWNFVYKINDIQYCTKICPEGENYIRAYNVCETLSPSQNDDDFYILNHNNVIVYVKNCEDYKDMKFFHVSTQHGIEKACNENPPGSTFEHYDGKTFTYYNSTCNKVWYVNYYHIPENDNISDGLTRRCNGENPHTPINKYKNSINEIVDNCTDNSFYYDFLSRSCLNECDLTNNKHVIVDKDRPGIKGCISFCPYDYPYWKGNDCFKVCEENYYIGNDKQCIPFIDCQDYIDLVTLTCVSEIELRYLNNETKFLVDKCQPPYPFLYETSNENGICVDTCPEDAPYVDVISQKCVSKCIGGAPFYNFEKGFKSCVYSCETSEGKRIKNYECVKDCDTVNKVTTLFQKNSLLYCGENCDEVNNYCMEIKNYTEFIPAMNAFIDDAFSFPFTKEEQVYEKFILQRYPIDEPFNLSSNTTSLSFKECGEILKASYDTLYVFKGELFRPNSHVNQLEYSIYDSNGNRIDLSVCQNKKITAQYILDESSGLDLELVSSMLNNHGIDILDPTNPFYHDICFSYTSEDGRDVVLRDRAAFCPNITLCDTDCQYSGIDIETLTVSCECFIKTEISSGEILPLHKEDYSKLYRETNIWLFQCYKVFLNIKEWKKNCGFYLLGILVIISIILIFVALCTYTQRKLLLTNLMIKGIDSPPKLSYSISNNSSSILSPSPMLDKGRSKKLNYVKEFILSSVTEYEQMSFPEAKKMDNRMLGKMFYDILLDKIDFIQVVCFPKEFEFRFISFSTYIFSLLLEFTLNAFLFSDDVISANYHNDGEMSIFTRIILSTLSNIITNAVMFILLRFIRYKEIMDLFAKEILKETPKLQSIKRYFRVIERRFILFYFLIVIFSGICFYFIIIFCSVYPNSQYNWIKDCFTAMIIELFKNFCKASGISLLRYISIRWGCKCIYYIALYFNNWNCIISI